MKKGAIKLDTAKLYGFNLTADNKKVQVSTAASAKIGIPKKTAKPVDAK